MKHVVLVMTEERAQALLYELSHEENQYLPQNQDIIDELKHELESDVEADIMQLVIRHSKKRVLDFTKSN